MDAVSEKSQERGSNRYSVMVLGPGFEPSVLPVCPSGYRTSRHLALMHVLDFSLTASIGFLRTIEQDMLKMVP